MSKSSAALEMLWRWDPIGIADVRGEIPGEYDDLAAALDGMMQDGADIEDVSKRLLRELRFRWGVDSSRHELRLHLEELARAYPERSSSRGR